MVHLHNGFLCASSTYQLQKVIWYTDHKETNFLNYFVFTMFEITKLRKCLWTLITRKRFLSHMGSSIIFKSPTWENEFEKRTQEKDFSPLWVLVYFFKMQIWENYLTHSLEVNGLSPLWVILCFFKSLARENVLEHWSQWKVLSQICILLCIIELPVRENYLVHWPQGNIFSPIFVLLCFFNKVFEICFFKLSASENDLVH